METEKTIALLRKMRHDFGNHLQVISGYLELKQPEKVQEYVDKLIMAIRAERIVFETTEGEAAIYLFEQMLAARDYGVELLYKDVKITAAEPLMQANEPLNSLLQLAQNINAEDLKVEVVIGPGMEQDIYIEYYSEALADNPYRLVIKE